jgi:hypothetical protein
MLPAEVEVTHFYVGTAMNANETVISQPITCKPSGKNRN